MKQEVKKYNNNMHVYGFVNDIRMNDTESGKKAINLDVATLESFKKEDGTVQNIRTYHDVVMYTDDKKVIAKYEKIAAALKKNAENKGVEGFEPEVHTVSLDGILVGKKDSRDLQVMAKPENVSLDVKQADKEVRNRAEIVGNIASIDVYPEKNFATMTVAHHYRPEGSKKEGESIDTFIPVRVSGARMYSKHTYDALVEGKLEVGDFIRVRGQLHNNNFEKDEKKQYTMALDLNSSELIAKKGAKQEQAAAKKPEAKQEAKPAKKVVPAKKVTPRKKGVQMQ